MSDNLIRKGLAARELLLLDTESYALKQTEAQENLLSFAEAGRFDEMIEVGKMWQTMSAYRKRVTEMVEEGIQLEKQILELRSENE